MTIVNRVTDGRMNLKVLVLKTDKLSAFPSPGFNFSHSMIVDAQIEFCFTLRR